MKISHCVNMSLSVRVSLTVTLSPLGYRVDLYPGRAPNNVKMANFDTSLYSSGQV